MKILVTGGNGFVGRHVIDRLLREGEDVVVGSRRADQNSGFLLGDISKVDLTPDALAPFHAIVHAAGMASLRGSHDAETMRMVNVVGTIKLATAAAAAGVEKFVFLSSAKVGGESTAHHRPLTETDKPAPLGPYAMSKLAAEDGLRELAGRSSLALTILRPPMVYGVGARGNISLLAKALLQGIPLPLGRAEGLRSLIGARNLADAIVAALYHPSSANECFYVSDGQDMTSADLLRGLGAALDLRPNLIAVPPGPMAALARLLGREDYYTRLFAPFQVDDGHIRARLGWTAPFSVEDELQEFASDYRS